MAYCNVTLKEITFKVAVLGAQGAGKSTYIRALKKNLSKNQDLKKLSLSLEPFAQQSYLEQINLSLGLVGGFLLKANIFCLDVHCPYPYLSYFYAKELDGAIYLFDSSLENIPEGLEGFELYKRFFKDLDMEISTLPITLYYNKRDLEHCLPVDLLNQKMNKFSWPNYSGSTYREIDIEESFRNLSKQLFAKLSNRNKEKISYEL